MCPHTHTDAELRVDAMPAAIAVVSPSLGVLLSCGAVDFFTKTLAALLSIFSIDS